MKIFICVLALVTLSNALFFGRGSNGGGGGSGGNVDFHGPPPEYHHPPSKHIVDIFHHSAPAPANHDDGFGAQHTHVVKVVHESAVPAHHEEPIRVIKVINEANAPLVHHAPAAHVQVVKILHEHGPIEEPVGW